MLRYIKYLGPFFGWMVSEHVKDYRDNKARIYDAILKANAQINQIILTVSVASLAAVVALNKEVFVPYGVLSFIVVALFIIVILLSVINLYFAVLASGDLQRQLNQNWKSLKQLSRGINDLRFRKTQKVLNALVLSGFCLGLISLMVLFGIYILGLGV